MDSINIRGIEYHNVVVVKCFQLITIPRSKNSDDDKDKEIDIELTYWVAKGIGVVKLTGPYNQDGEDLVIELVETNLVANH